MITKISSHKAKKDRFVCENPAWWNSYLAHPAEKIINFLFFCKSHERSLNYCNILVLTTTFVIWKWALHHSCSNWNVYTDTSVLLLFFKWMLGSVAIEIGPDSCRTPLQSEVDQLDLLTLTVRLFLLFLWKVSLYA